MIINNNIAAMNTHRQLSFNNTNVGKNLEKLSSGFQINRAGDDAAGLAISEKMRAQIKGLDMASKNAQDGISLIQTAEGALAETHSILQRMRELAVQSSSDTNMNEIDREAMQEELNALMEEIDSIADRTEFNTQKLIDGSFNGKNFHIGANQGQNISVSIGKMDTGAIGLNTGTAFNLEKVSGTADLNEHFGLADATLGADATVYKNGDTIVAIEVSGNVYRASDVIVTGAAGSEELAVRAGSESLTATEVTNGADADLANGVPAQASGSYKIDGLGVSIATRDQADAAIKTINDALNVVSTQRADLGAIQNRLEHTINNLGASSENLSAAESRIRDTDMAKEMMEFTKNNILTQAAQAMLAQANQQPQGVLQLLR